MWGFPLSFWESVFVWVTVAAFVLGGLSITSALISALLGYKISDVVQQNAAVKIAEANARAAEAILALEKLKKPRRLIPEQQALLVEKLKPFAGTQFDLAAKDPEPLDFALDIERALTAAGWTIRSWTDTGTFTHLPGRSFVVGHVVLTGVAVQMRDPSLSRARDAFVNALTLAGFERVYPEAADVPPGYPNGNVLHIMIGTKP